jgi:ribonucleoside-diphosphate reductase alpha chain
MTRNPEVPFAKSLVDYIFRWLAMEFVPGYRAANAPKRPESTPREPASQPAAPLPSPEPTSRSLPPPAPLKRGGNGHGPRIDPDTAMPFEYPGDPAGSTPPRPQPGTNLRLTIVADPLSQQTTELMGDAPACDVCGSITVRNGTCYKCLNCGNSMGCS